MQTRYMERTNLMKERGKRILEGGGDEEQEPERKRPALVRDQGELENLAEKEQNNVV